MLLYFHLVHVQHRMIAFHRVRQVDRRRARFHGRLQHVDHEAHIVRAVAEVFRAVFDVSPAVHQLFSEAHTFDDAFLHLGFRHVEHVFHRELACGEECVDAGMFRILDGVPGLLNVARSAARERGDDRLHARDHGRAQSRCRSRLPERKTGKSRSYFKCLS